jgi:hypothetical protein
MQTVCCILSCFDGSAFLRDNYVSEVILYNRTEISLIGWLGGMFLFWR